MQTIAATNGRQQSENVPPQIIDSSSASAKHHTGGICSMDTIRQHNQRALFRLLDSLDGPVALVWDAALMKPFNFVAGFRLLQSHSVAHMFPLVGDQAAPTCAVEHVVYLLTNEQRPLAALIDNVSRSDAAGDRRRHHAVFVPAASALSRDRLAPLLAKRLESIKELPIRLLSIDATFATMFVNDFIPSLMIDRDWTLLHNVAMAVDQLRTLFGTAPIVYKGDWAERVVQILDTRYTAGDRGSTSSSSINAILLIDRCIDPVSPLLTQLTYEGLIDEIFTITNGVVQLPRDKLEQQTDASTSGTGELQSINLLDDTLYSELRHLHFNAVGPALSRHIKALADEQEVGKQCKSVHEYKEFVKRLPQLKLRKHEAALHTTIAELIKTVTTGEQFLDTLQCEHEILAGDHTDTVIARIEDAIVRGEPLHRILRLICLQSHVAVDGLRAKTLDHYSRLIVQSYGCSDALEWLLQLRRANLLHHSGTTVSRLSSSKFAFIPANRQFRLNVANVDEKNPTDIAYVHSGYAPLLIRLCENWMINGAGCVDSWRILAGAQSSSSSLSTGSNRRRGGRRGSLLLFVIGGITYAEISALHLLANKHDYPVLIASTHVTNGNSMIESMRQSRHH